MKKPLLASCQQRLPSFEYLFNAALFFGADEEEGKSAGAGVGTNDRIYLVHYEIGNAEAFRNLRL